jgi:uncharacterized protein YabN with tetrapyrrole methylase and pyrophosphatase domain
MPIGKKIAELIAIEREVRGFGFDWVDLDMIVDQTISECEEVRQAKINNEPLERLQEEVGDVIHSAISLCLYSGFDVEQTIEMVTKKFSKRIEALKFVMKKYELSDLRDQPVEFLNQLWLEAKQVSDPNYTADNNL